MTSDEELTEEYKKVLSNILNGRSCESYRSCKVCLLYSFCGTPKMSKLRPIYYMLLRGSVVIHNGVLVEVIDD